MCSTSFQHRNFSNASEPFPFSAYHLLRTCNRLILPNTDAQGYYTFDKKHNHLGRPADTSPCEQFTATSNQSKSPLLDVIETVSTSNSKDSLSPYQSPIHEVNRPTTYTTTPSECNSTARSDSSIYPKNNESLSVINLPALSVMPLSRNSMFHSKSTLPGFEYIAPANHSIDSNDFPLMDINRMGVFPPFMHRRPRGEKRPIPDDQKDEKYYERRKRNNEAAKKSRDARKIREDRIAFRAALLEQENSLLRAQIIALRDELQIIRRQLTGINPTALVGRN